MLDFYAFCRYFYASRYLPIAYYENDTCIYSEGFPKDIPMYQNVQRVLTSAPQNPAAYTAADTGLYGILRIPEAGGYFLLGPAYSGNISKDLILTYMADNAIPRSREQEITQFLYAVPHYSYNRFLNVLLFLHLILNGEELNITEHFGVSDLSYEKEMAARLTKYSYLAREEQQQHGTYFFERRLLEYVKQGDPDQMRKFLLDTVMEIPLTEGKLADDPLRQAKNLFLGTVTMVGKDGAIPGGMDIEQTYQLIDTYIQECERLQSIDEVKNLQFNMLIDFTSRVAQAQLPEGISEEVFSCMQYIATHLTETITVPEVAAHIGKSRAYTAAKFKAETGKNVGQYITECRMREAKSLLRYTDMSLAEISDYLHFANQPYFQNSFKKFFGITPIQYRNTSIAYL
ncbi:MAG: helix-turn-helix domain-containing protein [Ruminococcaceae bacterium]|nr:helix-turn-helix domain-containing protein [Oscillospiraceae bacterium]